MVIPQLAAFRSKSWYHPGQHGQGATSHISRDPTERALSPISREQAVGELEGAVVHQRSSSPTPPNSSGVDIYLFNFAIFLQNLPTGSLKENKRKKTMTSPAGSSK